MLKSATHSHLSRKAQWHVVFFILLITIINYLDRSAISYAILPLEKEFHIGNQDFGLIASAFGVGYLGMCFFAGSLVDRFGAVRLWFFSAIAWSLATLLMSVAQGFWSLFFFRLILGLAEAVHFPALLRVMAHWLEPAWRARCISIGLLGVPIASVIGAPLLSSLIGAFDWRVMFVVLGLVGGLWACFWAFFFWKKEVHFVQREKISYRQLLSTPLFLGNCFNFFIFGYVVFFALAWLPGYIEQSFQVDLLKTGRLIIFPWLASAFFVLVGGFVSDALWKKTGSVRIARVYPIAVGMALSGLSFLMIAFSNQLNIVVLFFSLGLGLAFFINSPLYSLNADLFKGHVGKAQGMMTGFFALAGIIAPALTGWLAKSTGSFKGAILVVSLLSIASPLIALFFQREPKRD